MFDKTTSILLNSEKATMALGSALAQCLRAPLVIFLHGDLGAGKTTMVRGLIQALGHQGAVKSPTYTLVEPYQLAQFDVYHFDLYRLADPEELEFMGIRDYFQDSVCCIEWSEKGQGVLPQADLEIDMLYDEHQRKACLKANTKLGQHILNHISLG